VCHLRAPVALPQPPQLLLLRTELIGTSPQGQRLRATIGDDLDAANGATTKMMCEAALAMAEDEAQLPKATGVITPSVALGDVLEKRLLKAGMRVEVTQK
jgi:short subunit dehydrogenase-like uncharacterized protein